MSGLDGLDGALNAMTLLWTLLTVAAIRPKPGIAGRLLTGLRAGFIGAVLILSS